MYNTEKIIKKFKSIHGDKYDYSNVDFIKTTIKVCIICPEHGEFYQEPHAHIKGQGCPKCGVIKRSINKTNTTEQFIEKAKSVHGDKYNYENVKYINTKTKVEIICPLHGPFSQEPHNHLQGYGCPTCGNKLKGSTTKITTYNFIKQENKIHNFRYKYDKISSYELELGDFIASIIGEKNIIKNDRTVLNGNKLDIYIPSKNIAFEFDGLYWHSEIKKPDKKYHLNKTDICLSKGIQLIHIFEDEWVNKKEICKSRILNLLGESNRIFARKCTIVEIPKQDSKIFFNENHIQGNVNASIIYGLKYNDDIVAMMSFGGLRKNMGQNNTNGSFEMLRFCNKQGYNIIGGASKLFKHFIKNNNPNEIISYADRRWSNGNLYEKIGFSYSHKSEPSYFYVINGERKNRFGYRKDILISKYGCSPTDTEHNFCFSQGWYRIYDCGTKVYKWNNPSK